jgi:putative FmdB family regulatory protein
MPFYEYQCQRCGHHLESMQKVNDPPLRKCPECGKAALTRLMSAPVFRLKGGGWYETDFKSDGEGKKNLADRPEAGAAKDDKKEVAAKDGGAKDGGAKDGGAKDGGAKDGGAKEGGAKEGGTKEGGTKEGGTKEAAPKEAVAAKDGRKPAAATTSAGASPARPTRRSSARAMAPKTRKAVKKASRRR